MGGAPADLRQQQGFRLFLLACGNRRGRFRRRLPHKGFHCLEEGIPTHFNQIIQSRLAADPLRKSAPFSVGDPQAVVGFGAVDIAGHMDKLLCLVILQIGRHVHFFRFCDYF